MTTSSELLDAVNLIALSDDIRVHGVLFAYDRRMLDGALLEGMPAWSPRSGS